MIIIISNHGMEISCLNFIVSIIRNTSLQTINASFLYSFSIVLYFLSDVYVFQIYKYIINAILKYSKMHELFIF